MQTSVSVDFNFPCSFVFINLVIIWESKSIKRRPTRDLDLNLKIMACISTSEADICCLKLDHCKNTSEN
jgi:hypothetical protein